MRFGVRILFLILLSGCSIRELPEGGAGPGFTVGTQVMAGQEPGNLPSQLEAAMTAATDSLLTSVNLRRALAGVAPLILQPELTEIANDRAAEIAFTGYTGHVDPRTGVVIVEQLLRQAGYSGQAAELLFDSMNPLDGLAEQTVQTWFASADHELVLLGPEFRYAGFGVMGDGERWFVVAVFTGELP